jgi:transcriptional regulator with PAS, ATPase and Fis domain
MGKAPNWKDLIVKQLFERDKNICQLCEDLILQDDLYEIDHIIEKKNGGTDDLGNMRVVHLVCHKRRHIKNKHPHGALSIVATLKEVHDKTDRGYIIRALNKSKNLTQAALELGITRPTLYDKMKRLNIHY